MALLNTCRLWGRSPFHRHAFRVSDRNGIRFHGRELSTEQGQGQGQGREQEGEQGGARAQEHEQDGSLPSNIPAMSSMEQKSTSQEEEYDFRTLPELKSSFYENYELPSSMLLRKKRPHLLMKSLNLASNALFRSNQGMEAIPPFKGIPYDFGLKAITPPPLEARGGGFDIKLSFDDNLDEESSSMEETSSLSSSVKIGPTSMPLGEGYDSKSFPKLKRCGLYRNHEIPNTETV